MKKLLYVFAFLGLLTFSCSDDSDPIRACGMDNVLEMPWIQQQIAETESTELGRDYWYISTGTYHSQTVFLLQNCCPMCNTIVPIFDCGGNTLGTLGSSGISLDDISDRKVIWKSSNNSCNI
ncbi:hypothetical protein J0A68_19585 [Algoriphagus sp. H41]|uniref:Lipoprotein n=1 Tax=Algoriphagus oliviformis TaxID=2811231 RepID=A0ABS3C863_9BACT|nr:hypothetical protein [Algoriphagus oliviformis]MBN7813167.1 hypothetical protein [Algoriphagus oliviformis]